MTRQRRGTVAFTRKMAVTLDTVISERQVTEAAVAVALSALKGGQVTQQSVSGWRRAPPPSAIHESNLAAIRLWIGEERWEASVAPVENEPDPQPPSIEMQPRSTSIRDLFGLHADLLQVIVRRLEDGPPFTDADRDVIMRLLDRELRLYDD